MVYPGLNTMPYHDTKKFNFVKDFESNVESVKKEYLELKKAYGEKDDYEKYDGEHTLNNGQWHWMNYVTKGLKK